MLVARGRSVKPYVNGTWGVVQFARRVNPQMAHVATPVVGSISRKLGQPLVPQKIREPVFATDVRRRIRRMELARPAKVVVAERDIMVKKLVLLSGAPQDGLGLGRGRSSGCSALDSPSRGPERFW